MFHISSFLVASMQLPQLLFHLILNPLYSIMYLVAQAQKRKKKKERENQCLQDNPAHTKDTQRLEGKALNQCSHISL